MRGLVMSRGVVRMGLYCLAFGILFFGYFGIAEASLSLTGDTHATSSVGVALPIDLQIAGAAASTTPINLVVTNGTLTITNTGGLTFNTGLSASTLNFSGTVANINAALETLTYTRGGTGTDTLEVSLVNQGEVFFPGTGNLYEYISSTLTWTAARDAAALLTRYGATGYLTTITSQAENDFVAERLTNAGWMGASDAAVEGAWRWVTGPETGTQFWSGAAGGSAVGGNYQNWNTGEPNDSSGNEDCGQFLAGGSGRWNDLPCSGTTLPGYVVEFGAPGNQVTVVSATVALATVNSPTVVALTPADNASAASVNGELVIQFSANMATGTGNVTVYDASDDSVVEAIDVTGSQVNISGNTVTITLTEDLEESTSYYVQIANTAFVDLSAFAYAGIANQTTWNFTTGDFTAPVISAVSSVGGTATATVSWTTNELSSSRVVYGPTTGYGLVTAESDTSPRVTAHEVVLASLLPCTTYHYRVVSRDATLNTATSSDATFTTSGCTSAVVPSKATSTAVDSTAGGATSLTEDNTTITVTAPSNFTSTSSSVVIQISALSSTPVLAGIGVPNSLPEPVSGIVFDVKAIIDGDTILDSFDVPITITYTYTDEDVVGIRESSLWLYHYHNGAWVALDNCSLNETINTISCTTDGFSIFALFGSLASTGGGSGSTATRIGCTDKNAINYRVNVRHDAKRCVYAVAGTTPSPIATPVANQMLFLRDLTLGSTGEDVRSLQQLLNAQGFLIAASGVGSVGNESDYFGSYTKAALARFQAAKGITPAAGYFGPITRAMVQGTVEVAHAVTTDSVMSVSLPAPASSAALFMRDLTGGDSGEDVVALQNFLIQAGYSIESGATGYFGAQTKSALSAYQAAKGITPATGYFGPRTRMMMAQ